MVVSEMPFADAVSALAVILVHHQGRCDQINAGTGFIRAAISISRLINLNEIIIFPDS